MFNLLKVIANAFFSKKANVIVLIIFMVIFTIYCCNPYVINPAEFTLYTKYFIPIGVLVWGWIGYQLWTAVEQVLPTDFFDEDIRLKKLSVYSKLIFGLILLFICIFQLIQGALIATVITFIFNSSIKLTWWLFKLYFIHFGMAFIISSLIGMVCCIWMTRKKSIVSILLCIILLFEFIFVIGREFVGERIELLILNRFIYIDPIFSLTNANEQATWKLLFLFICLIALVFSLILKMNKPLVILLPLLFLFFNVKSVDVFSKQASEVDLVNEDKKLMNLIEHSSGHFNGSMDGWNMEKIEFDLNSKIFHVVMDVKPNKEKINFSLNEQFKITKIISKDGTLDFKQSGHIVTVNTNGKGKEIELFYTSKMGSYFFNIFEKSIYLPYFANWYPQSNVNSIYTFNQASNYIEIENNSGICTQMDLKVVHQKFVWQGENAPCITLVKGNYTKTTIGGVDFLIYDSMIAKDEQYKMILKNLENIQKEYCQISSRRNLCDHPIQSILIKPKQGYLPYISYSDVIVHQGFYIISVDPFSDVNTDPISKYVSEIASIALADDYFEDQGLRYYAADYISERLGFNKLNYLSLMMQEKKEQPANWDEFIKLNLGDKKKFIHKMTAVGEE